MSKKTVTIFSKANIQIFRELAFRDDTPDIAKAGTIVGSGNFIRVQNLTPVSYTFVEGENIIPEPYTFLDPTTKKEVSESILSWAGVKHLIANGTFKAFNTDTALSDDEAVKGKTTKIDSKDEEVTPTKRKKLSEVAE